MFVRISSQRSSASISATQSIHAPIFAPYLQSPRVRRVRHLQRVHQRQLQQFHDVSVARCNPIIHPRQFRASLAKQPRRRILCPHQLEAVQPILVNRGFENFSLSIRAKTSASISSPSSLLVTPSTIAVARFCSQKSITMFTRITHKKGSSGQISQIHNPRSSSETRQRQQQNSHRARRRQMLRAFAPL